MKLNRRTFFRIHSWIGIKISLLFFIVCFSGTLATLSNEMDWLFFPAIRANYQEHNISQNEKVANVQAAYPKGKITFWSAANAPYLCDVVYVSSEGQRYYVFSNPYTGKVQGATTLTFQRFFRDLHYFLFIPYQIGHFIVLIFGFMLFISAGTALLFYKNWWRKLFELKIGKGSIVFYRSLHRLIGVWSVPFALLFSLTGIWYFAERTNTAGISDTANTKTPAIENLKIDSAAFASISYAIDYDQAIEAAQKAIPHLQVKDFFPPNGMDKPLYLNGLSDVPLVRNRANRVYIHPTTYQVVSVQKAEEVATVTWLNDIADPLHFGYWGGIATKIIWFVGGLAISGLVLTGVWIALKRKVKHQAKRKQQQLGSWKYINWGVAGLSFVLMCYFIVVRYAMSIEVALGISVLIGIMACIAWYFFVYKINLVKEKAFPVP